MSGIFKSAVRMSTLRPFTVVTYTFVISRSATDSSTNRTNPKPLLDLEMGSRMIWCSFTSPYC